MENALTEPVVEKSHIAMFYRFAEGFSTLGLLEELRKNPKVFYSMFVNEERPLQAKDLNTLFEVVFSEQGSNRRAKENKTICFWRDWLIDVEGIFIALVMLGT